VEMKRVKDIARTPKCPECGETKLGVLGVPDDDVKKILDKKGQRLAERDKNILARAEDTAKLVNAHGILAVYALSGRRVSLETAHERLRKDSKPSNKFFEASIEAEKEALRDRFWR